MLTLYIRHLMLLLAANLLIASPATADIYHFAQDTNTTELEALLAQEPDAWNTGEDYLGDTAVGMAIDSANLAALKLFVLNGYNLNPPDWFDHPLRMISPYTGTDSPEHIRMMAWILLQVEPNPSVDYALIDFVENDHLDGARVLLEYGANPNTVVNQWYSALDLAESDAMRALLKAHGGSSNFYKFIGALILLVIVLVMLVRYLLSPKQTTSEDGSAAQPERNQTKGKLYLGLSLVLMLLGAASILITRYGAVFGLGRSNEAGTIIVIGIALFALGIRLASSGHKLRTRDAQEVLQQKSATKTNDTRPSFLYLRSFILDQEDGDNKITLPYGLSVPINPWESGLASAFSKVGDLIAIGRPGEKLATTGAMRLYVNDDEWQDKVIEMVEKCELIIWTYGATEGLRWEISRLVKMVPPEKLVLAIPFWDKKMPEREDIWKDAQNRLADVFPKPLPANIGHPLFIQFDNTWEAHWVDIKPPPMSLKKVLTFGTWSAINESVKKLLQHHGYQYPELSTGEKLFYGVLAAAGWLVVGVLLVMMYGLYIAFFG